MSALTIYDYGLFLGAPCKLLSNGFDNQHNGEYGIVMGASISNGMVEVLPGHWWNIQDTQLSLRPISSLTESEARELYGLVNEKGWAFSDNESENGSCLKEWWQVGDYMDKAAVVVIYRWLLLHYFDLFGWIDAGLALDATKNP